ncbi:MAG: J domain-containing protein [Anderseniella sp.]|jgi:curved DNA-binding protein CbpA|nr:J domain-containing protein [Anderseniella sp.]
MRFDLGKDYFAVLGVAPQADPAVVKAAYRALAKKYHPDRQQDGEERATQRFQELQEAYELLGDEERREQYLRYRERLRQQERSSVETRYRPPIRLLLDDRWDHLVREHPELGRHHARFCFISHRLAQQFKLIVLGTQKRCSFNKVAARMERQFYRKHFSYHRDLQLLARRLANRRKRHALRELAREINGRRLLLPRSRRAIVERFEARYLNGVRPARPASAISQFFLPRAASPEPLRQGS